MKNYIIAIDQSTSATKVMLFNESCELIHRVNIEHKQYYPQPGRVEHDAKEIYENTVEGIRRLLACVDKKETVSYSITITNQRETVVVWDKHTGKPFCNAVVWQCLRGTEICENLKEQGFSEMVQQKSGLLLDPYFSASGVKWILDNLEGARASAETGTLLMGTIDSWLIWKLTGGKVHATDYTNASRTLLFNIHTLKWDEELLQLFGIPCSMMPQVMPCDSVFGDTDVEGLFPEKIQIAGAIGDSHGALVGQMCFESGMGKATYGTGSSVMVNIGEDAIKAPSGLVTSVGFAACGKVYYAFEGNIHCTGATIKWLADKLKLIESPAVIEELALTVPDNGGVYFVPAFAGLGAPWWNSQAKAMICGMTLSSEIGHIARAALEAIAYQVKDLIDLMTNGAGIPLKELRVDGGPTKNKLLMQFQSDMLHARINRSEVEEASAMGALIMNGLARGTWKNLEEVARLRTTENYILPIMKKEAGDVLYAGWLNAIKKITI